MPTGPKGQRRPADVIGKDVPVKPEKNKAAAEMGRKGAASRLAKLSPEERAEIARKAAAKR